MATFVCANCGGEFEEAWDDEEAQAEAVRDFGKRGEAPGMAVVCDDCYKTLMSTTLG
jgi:hypothetical protein